MIEHDLCSTIVNIDYSAVAIKMQKECSRAQPRLKPLWPARQTTAHDSCAFALSWGIKVTGTVAASVGSDRTAPSRNRHDTARCAYVVMECSQLLFDGSTFDFVIDKASNLSLGLA
jgi:hypothetical protein